MSLPSPLCCLSPMIKAHGHVINKAGLNGGMFYKIQQEFTLCAGRLSGKLPSLCQTETECSKQPLLGYWFWLNMNNGPGVYTRTRNIWIYPARTSPLRLWLRPRSGDSCFSGNVSPRLHPSSSSVSGSKCYQRACLYTHTPPHCVYYILYFTGYLS